MEEFLGYRVVESLYEGRGIHVFRGEHQDDHSFHILKALVSGSPEQVVAFRHEYQINHSLQIPGLVHCQQLIEKGDRRLLVFEDAGGVTLRHYLDGQALALNKFFPIAIEMVSCLEDLHSNKVIHKDIKPDNILVDPETLSVKLLDLSISTQLESEIHEAVSVDKLEGSLAYIAPEQTGRMNRPMDYRSDYYALGFTFFEMLTGRLPFVRADALGYVHAHMAVMPDPVSTVNPHVPEMLSKIVAKLVSKQAEDRYQSAEGLKADLQRCFQEWNSTKTIAEFSLGEHEAYYKLIVSPKIFGRDQEVETLMSTFERVARGASECLLISGNSGIGKSRLVNEVQWPIIRKKGFFVRGKFDLLQRSTPYTAFTEAFTNLFKHWLCLPEAKFQEKKEKLNKAMGVYGQVIVEFFPYLEKIMGKQPEIDKLPPEQAQNRFFYHFQNFIECISSPEEPLVMFIDDLQWIDQGSLRLLEIMLTTQDVRSFLFIGAYRDNEVDESHPFIKLMDKLKKANGNIKDIILKPLKLFHTQEFLGDSLRMDTKSVLPLAEMLFEKTAGNPFFSLEFLKECFAQKFLTYDHKECLWHWDLEKISSMAGTDNVIDLMLTKINQMPELSQRLLQIGSCLGMNFDGDLLREIQGIDVLAVPEALSPILKAGMIQRIDQGLKYKFIHDRIQQAAYQTLSDENKQQLHVTIGRMLLGDMKRTDGVDKLFEILDHFKLGTDLITDNQEQSMIAELSLRSGRQAIDSGAYQAAEGYLKFGLDLARNINWDDNHNLLWGLNTLLIENLYLENEAEKAMDLSLSTFPHAITVEEKLIIYNFQMKINMLRRRYVENQEIYSFALSTLGLSFPKHVSPIRVHFEYMKLYLALGKGKKFVNKFIDLKPAKDDRPYLLWELTFYMSVSNSYTRNKIHQAMCAIPIAHYVLKNGSHPHATYLIIYHWGIYRYSLNNSFSELKIYYEAYKNTSDNFSTNNYGMAGAKVPNLIPGGYFLKIRDLRKASEEAFRAVLGAGVFSLLEGAAFIDMELLYFSDLNLRELKEENFKYLNIAKKLGLKRLTSICNNLSVFYDHLMNSSSPLIDENIDSLLNSETRETGFVLAFNLFLQENFIDAMKKLRTSWGWAGAPSITNQNHKTLYILVLGKIYKDAKWTLKWKYRKEIRKALKALEKVSDCNPANFLHLYLLGQAELARIQGKSKKALKLYQQAIDAAKDQDFIRWVAMTNERVADLYLEMGEDTIASVYIHEAIYYYQHWGCTLKVKQLNRRHSTLLIDKHLRKDPKDIKPGETGANEEGELDLSAMLKASQAISSEIQLDKLLPRILQVVVECSGADKVAFIGLRKEDWVIESLTEHKGDEFISTMMNEILTPDSDLPEDFISNTIRSSEIEVLSDMSQNEKYTSLSYVQQYRTKSALCLPIVRDGKALAALYLENQMTADCFTPERVQLLKSLSAQIAISLENARYFEHTQELFRSTERFVPKKFLELLGRKNIEEVSKGDNVKLEMSAIFADLRDFTTVSESIEPEQLTFVLNTYLKYMSPIIRNNHGFVNRVLGDGILALFPNDSQDAVQASIEMLEAAKSFNQEINAAGFDSIQMGIGVNTGPAMLCALGEDERIEANVVSDMVNAASRIESLNKVYGTKLLISDLTYNKLKDPSKFSIRLVDTVRVKGKTKPLGLYEILPKTSDESYFEDFQKALNLYTEGKFKAANHNFIKCLKQKPDDAVAQLYADRCRAYQDNTPHNWDGITTMLEK